jgi:hypothetical protein
MSDAEQVFGREATEAAQGYVPMPEPTTDKPAPDLEHAEAINKWADDRAQEARPIIERQYFNEADTPQPENRTVELDRAAIDLAGNREAEAAIAELERTEQLAAEIDAARRHGEGHSLRAQEAQQPAEAQQPQTPPVSELQQPQNAPADNGDDEVIRVLQQNPKVLAAIKQERMGDIAKVDTAINSAAQWAQQNAALAAAALLNRSELKNIPPSQLPGAIAALAQSNPDIAADIQSQINQVQTLTQQYQEAQRVTQQRAAIQFQAFGAAQDAEFDRQSLASGETVEQRDALARYATKMLQDSGMSTQQIHWQWNNNPLLRSVAGQQVLADAARYRMAKATAAQKLARPVPQVNRPGSSMDRPAAADRDSFAIEQRFGGPKAPLSAKQAGDLLIARRARAR